MMSPLLWSFLWATAICYGSVLQVPVADLGLQQPQEIQTDLDAEVKELQKNVSGLWSYINELRHAMDNHLNHLHHHQEELEKTVHGMMHHGHGEAPSGRSTERGHDSHHHGDEHTEHGSHDDHHTDDHSGHGDHQGDDHSGHSDHHGDDHSGRSDHHGDDHSGHGDHHGDDHSGHGDHHGADHGDDHSGHGDHHGADHGDDHSGHGDAHAAHGDHHDDHGGSGHHGDEHQHEQHGEQIVHAERIEHHYHHGVHDHHHHGASETSNQRHQDSHEEVSHSDHHDSTDDQQKQEDTAAPIQNPPSSDHTTHESPERPRSEPSSDPLHILPHHHHHHHHHGHRQESSQNRIIPPRFKDFRFYDFATCEVKPNRAIPEDQQQDVTGQITLWQRKTGGRLNIHVRLQGFKIGDHHGNDDDQQQQQSDDDNQLTTQVSHTHGAGHRHGFHVHTVGNLSNGCQSTGAHYNPFTVNHGGPKATVRHAGDLGNIECDEHGITNILFADNVASLSGEHSILGRSLVESCYNSDESVQASSLRNTLNVKRIVVKIEIHSDTDDYGLKPDDAESLLTGNAGTRIACCVIRRVDMLPMRAEKAMKSAEQYQKN